MLNGDKIAYLLARNSKTREAIEEAALGTLIQYLIGASQYSTKKNLEKMHVMKILISATKIALKEAKKPDQLLDLPEMTDLWN